MWQRLAGANRSLMELHEVIDGIASKTDLVRFVEVLAADLHTHPDRWENDSLERYLQALGAWLEASDAVYKNQGQSPPAVPSWKDVAVMLYAATMYE
jgi:hypothetical protein